MVNVIYEITLFFLVKEISVFNFSKFITRVVVSKTKTKHKHIFGFLNRGI